MDPGIEATSLVSNLQWQASSLSLAPPGKSQHIHTTMYKTDNQQGPTV